MKKLAAILGLAFVALSVAVCLRATDGFDRAILLRVHAGSSTGADRLWLAINQLGGPFVVLPATALAVIGLAITRRVRDALVMAMSMGVSAPANLALRHAFHRVRPELWPSLQPNHSFVYGYPGGHATLVATLAASLVLVSRRRALVAAIGAIWVLGVGFSSLYLGVHYPSDLIGGWTMAILVPIGASLLPRFGRTPELGVSQR